MRFLDHALDEGGVCVFQVFLDEFGHEDVAAEIRVLSQIQPILRHTQAQLGGLFWLPRKRAAEGPFPANVEAERRVAVRLQTIGEVVEAAVVGYSTRDKTAGEVVDFVSHGVPGAMNGFFGVGATGGFAGMAFFDEGIEVNHFGVTVESFEDGGAGDAFGKGRYGGVGCSFGHGEREGEELKCW